MFWEWNGVHKVPSAFCIRQKQNVAYCRSASCKCAILSKVEVAVMLQVSFLMGLRLEQRGILRTT
jgi:hypothetical protein